MIRRPSAMMNYETSFLYGLFGAAHPKVTQRDGFNCLVGLCTERNFLDYCVARQRTALPLYLLLLFVPGLTFDELRFRL